MVGGWWSIIGSWRTDFSHQPAIAVPTILIALRHLPEQVDPDAKKGLECTRAALAFFVDWACSCYD